MRHRLNNSQRDRYRTGSLYPTQDVKEVYVKDNERFTMLTLNVLSALLLGEISICPSAPTD
ncbi:MAG TPA: hypothetical protein VF609_10195 [Flavisolibacter sp.]|jgi:hypothetical protein